MNVWSTVSKNVLLSTYLTTEMDSKTHANLGSIQRSCCCFSSVCSYDILKQACDKWCLFQFCSVLGRLSRWFCRTTHLVIGPQLHVTWEIVLLLFYFNQTIWSLPDQAFLLLENTFKNLNWTLKIKLKSKIWRGSLALSVGLGSQWVQIYSHYYDLAWMPAVRKRESVQFNLPFSLLCKHINLTSTCSSVPFVSGGFWWNGVYELWHTHSG